MMNLNQYSLYPECNDIRYIFVEILYLENVKNCNYCTGHVMRKNNCGQSSLLFKICVNDLIRNALLHNFTVIRTQHVGTTKSKTSFYLHCYKCHFD